MADVFLKPYLDANIYIATLKGPKQEDPERVRVSSGVLQLAENGEYQVFASALIEAEVIKAPGETSPLTADQEAKIAAYFERSFFVWLELDRVIARKARQLSRVFGMKPLDAIHVATAIRAQCDQLLTWDEKLHKGGRTIESVLICEPHLTGRQSSLFDDNG